MLTSGVKGPLDVGPFEVHSSDVKDFLMGIKDCFRKKILKKKYEK